MIVADDKTNYESLEHVTSLSAERIYRNSVFLGSHQVISLEFGI